MKKILLILMVFASLATYAQADFPEGIALPNIVKKNTATRIVVQDSITKEIHWILKSTVGTGTVTSVTGTNGVTVALGTTTPVIGLGNITPTTITTNSATLTPATAPSYAEGKAFYDSSAKTLVVYDDISGTSTNLGQELNLRARNNTGVTISNGAVVYISGATGQNPTIALARANSLSTSVTIGIATHDILNNTIGKITTFGLVNDLNTSAFVDGQVLYLSPNTAGILTSTVPSSPNYTAYVCVVLHSHITQGKIFVRPEQPISLNVALTDDNNTSPSVTAVKSYISTLDANNVKLTGAQTITGLKTFSSTETNFGSKIKHHYINDTANPISWQIQDLAPSQGAFSIGTNTVSMSMRESGPRYISVTDPIESPNGTASNHLINKSQLDLKQNTLTNPITGTGTIGNLPKFTGSGVLGNSLFRESGSDGFFTGTFGIDGGTGDGVLYNSELRQSRYSSTGNKLESKIVLKDQTTGHAAMIFKVKTTSSSATAEGFFTDAMIIRGNTANVLINTSTDNGSDKLQVAGSVRANSFISNGIIRLKNYTVATLPTGVQGDTAFVTDALAPSYLVTVMGGGAVATAVFYNGTNWVSH